MNKRRTCSGASGLGNTKTSLKNARKRSFFSWSLECTISAQMIRLEKKLCYRYPDRWLPEIVKGPLALGGGACTSFNSASVISVKMTIPFLICQGYRQDIWWRKKYIKEIFKKKKKKKKKKVTDTWKELYLIFRALTINFMLFARSYEHLTTSSNTWSFSLVLSPIHSTKKRRLRNNHI